MILLTTVILLLINLFISSFITIIKNENNNTLLFLTFANGIFFISSLIFNFYFHEYLISNISIIIYIVYFFLWNKEILKYSKIPTILYIIWLIIFIFILYLI